jgi:hypothetical protein
MAEGATVAASERGSGIAVEENVEGCSRVEIAASTAVKTFGGVDLAFFSVVGPDTLFGTMAGTAGTGGGAVAGRRMAIKGDDGMAACHVGTDGHSRSE